ncbi:hypothetical protein ACT17_14670 [Mycolicibacterium conceptionense]|uniref:Transmembrane protein n=1 Tax=Mycolicibacterium conceptionense TaxID=451644 RepID=A0A0J8U7P5_9MYCO|nr:hypothetical protein [Mycolicibacterium conceptionense]KMV17538.1 hypothetical protein ACT17_14670 [Mycolicibacterium conceptionense]
MDADDIAALIGMFLLALVLDAVKLFAGAGVIMWLAGTFTDYPLGYWTVFVYLIIGWVVLMVISPSFKSSND